MRNHPCRNGRVPRARASYARAMRRTVRRNAARLRAYARVRDHVIRNFYRRSRPATVSRRSFY